MSFISVVRAIHFAAGSVALASFSVPLLARKGGPTHRRFGWCFVVSITVVAISAFTAATYRLLMPSSVDVRRVAVFLGYLSLLSANSARTGLRALRFKSRVSPHNGILDIVFPAGLLLGGIALAFWGLADGFTLAVVFGIVGVIVAVRQLHYWLSKPSGPQHWKYQHMQSMVGASIAALTAFLVVNARALHVPVHLEMVAWLGPTLVGLPGVLIWVAYLRTRDAKTTNAPAGPA